MLGYFVGTPLTVFSSCTKDFRPRWLSRDHTDPFLCARREVHQFASLADFVRQRRPRSIVLYRTYALGDILMLLPLVRAFHRAMGLTFPVTIVVEKRFRVQLERAANRQVRFIDKRGYPFDYGADVHMNLNGVLEPDHRGGEESHMHRVDLYARALGLEIQREP
jgi:hypothetical protein